MQEKSETEMIAENLIRAFAQFSRLRLSVNPSKNGENQIHHGLKHSEIMLLYVLQEKEREYPEGISVSDISRSLRVKPPSITPIITSLEQKGMIRRTMDENDRRIIRVRMTDTGRQFIETSSEHMVEHVKGLVGYLGKEKSLTLTDLINEVFAYFISRAQSKKTAPKP